MSEEDLYPYFAGYGDIQSIHVLREKTTRKSQGCAFVQYLMPQSVCRGPVPRGRQEGPLWAAAVGLHEGHVQGDPPPPAPAHLMAQPLSP